MTLDDYRIECRWSKAELARQARIDVATLKRAIKGIPISLDTARKLASAVSAGLGYSVTWQQFEDLNVIQ
jgi:transcriptional regulator with XRE-family HTH domain